MKNQFKTKLALNKETVAKLNEEQMDLVAGGQAELAESTVIITDSLGVTGDVGPNCGPRSIMVSKTCPATESCLCVCE